MTSGESMYVWFARLSFAAVAVVLLVLGVGSAAAAQADDARDGEAHSLFEAGRAAFRDGRYDDALARFQEAYGLSHRADLLYNVGQCQDRLRRDAEAIAAFEQYLREVPDAENRDEVSDRLTALHEADALAAEAGALPPVSTVLVVEPDSPPPAATPVYDEWWFWTAIGVVVALAIAIPVGIVAGSRSESQSFIPGDVGPGGIVIALEFGP